MVAELRHLLKQDPELARSKILEWLSTGKTLKDLAEELNEPYPTLHRICRDLGLKGLGASFLKAISREEWAQLSKRQIADKYSLSYSHVYNFYIYHKEEINEGIRAWKLENSPSTNSTNSTEDD